MKYPLISEYVSAIRSAEDNLKRYSHLRPVLGADGMPVMNSGNFAVVFKMQNPTSGKLYAMKCFTKHQENRDESYKLIVEELEDVHSEYIIPIQYLEKELFVDSATADETEFPVLLMDWVDGITLDRYMRAHARVNDSYTLKTLAYLFSKLAAWLLQQPFAHGDLKPDNIIVRNNGSLALVDYDGMFVPAMRGQSAREHGSPDFRHPNRTEKDFDEHIDDFSAMSILLSLQAIALNPHWVYQYGAEDRLLLSKGDYMDIGRSCVLRDILSHGDVDVQKTLGLFLYVVAETRLPNSIEKSVVLLKSQNIGVTHKEKLVGLQILDAEDVSELGMLNYYGVDDCGEPIESYRLNTGEGNITFILPARDENGRIIPAAVGQIMEWVLVEENDNRWIRNQLYD